MPTNISPLPGQPIDGTPFSFAEPSGAGRAWPR